MPRPRGGKRTGRTGAAYTNRSDLQQAVRTAPGQPYGQAGAQAQAQKAIPLPNTPATVAPPMQPPAPAPPQPGILHAPTARPGEPIQAGLPIGAGPGPEALATGGPQDQVLANLYRAYQLAPTDGLRALIDQTERANGRSY